MDTREAAGWQKTGGDDAITTRLGAVALPLAIIVILVSELFHPSREDPMDNPAVFREYAASEILLLLGGLVALYYSVGAGPGKGAGLAPFALAAATYCSRSAL